MVIIVAAFWEYVLVGVYRIQASEAGIRKSNETFKRATLGLFGVFSLFLLVFTVNKGLLTGDVGLVAFSVGGSGGGVGQQVVIQPTTQIPQKTPSGTDNTSISGDAAIRQLLAKLPNGGVTVNKDVCGFVTQLNCTSLGGLPQETITMITNLRQTCSPGPIQISGGTEAGHSSHGPGKYPVDFSMGGTLETCIRSFTPSSRVPKRANGAALCYPGKVYENFGYIFCDESESAAHWHVSR